MKLINSFFCMLLFLNNKIYNKMPIKPLFKIWYLPIQVNIMQEAVTNHINCKCI